MVQIVVTIEGLEQIVSKLGASPPIHAQPIRDAFTHSALELEARAKALTPRRTGNLQRSISHRIDGAAIPTFAEVGLLGGGPASKSGARYGVYVHEGTRAHTIAPRRGRFLVFVAGGKRIFARRVRHPGTRPQPFLRRAFEELQGAISARFAAAARAIESTWGR